MIYNRYELIEIFSALPIVGPDIITYRALNEKSHAFILKIYIHLNIVQSFLFLNNINPLYQVTFSNVTKIAVKEKTLYIFYGDVGLVLIVFNENFEFVSSEKESIDSSLIPVLDKKDF